MCSAQPNEPAFRAIIDRLKPPPFYPLLDTGILAQRGFSVEAAAEAILEGGARILQLRHKTEFSRDTLTAANRIAELCHRAGALFVVNDRADIALLTGAALHLGQDDLPVEAARRLLGFPRAIGLSTHNEGQLRQSRDAPADYVALGPLFSTGTKRNPDPVVGLVEFARLRAFTLRPLVAIGGITRLNARQAIAAGADSVAIVADLIPEDIGKRSLRARTEEWQQLLRN